MSPFITYLKKFPDFSQELLEDILPFLESKTLKEGEHFLKQGNASTQLAFIEKGMLRIYHTIKEKEITTCFCNENSISCAYDSLVSNSSSTVSIQAIEPTRLITFSYTVLKSLFEQDIFWQRVGRLALEQELIKTECHNRFISDTSATERYMHVLENDPHLLMRVPLHYLASYLQVTPETLSRIRKKITQT